MLILLNNYNQKSSDTFARPNTNYTVIMNNKKYEMIYTGNGNFNYFDNKTQSLKTTSILSKDLTPRKNFAVFTETEDDITKFLKAQKTKFTHDNEKEVIDKLIKNHNTSLTSISVFTEKIEVKSNGRTINKTVCKTPPIINNDSYNDLIMTDEEFINAYKEFIKNKTPEELSEYM